MTVVRPLHTAWALCLAGLLLCVNSALAQDANCRNADEEMARLDRTLRDALITAVPDERGRLVRTAEGTVQRIERLPICTASIDPGLGITTTYRHGEIARLKFRAVSALMAILPATGARPTIRQLSGMGSALAQLGGFLSMGGGDTGAIEAMRDNLVQRIAGVRVRPAGLAPTGSLLPGREILISQEIAADSKGLVFSQFVLDPHAKRASWRPVKAKAIGGDWRPEGYAVGIEIAVPDPAGLADRHRKRLGEWRKQGVALRLGRSEKRMPGRHMARGVLMGESPCAGIWLQDTGEAPTLRLYDLGRSALIAQWDLDGGRLNPALAGVVQRILRRLAPASRQPVPSQAKAFGKRLSLPLAPFLTNARALSRLPEKENIGLVLRYRNPNCARSGIAVSLPHCSALQLECAARPGLEAYLVLSGRRTGGWNTTDWYGDKGVFGQDIKAIRGVATGQSAPPSSQKTTVALRGAPTPVGGIAYSLRAISPVEDRTLPSKEAFSIPMRSNAKSVPKTPHTREQERSTPENARIKNVTIKPKYEPGMKIGERVYGIGVSAPGFAMQQTGEEGGAPPSPSRAQKGAPRTAAAGKFTTELGSVGNEGGDAQSLLFGKLTPALASVGNTGNTRRSRTIFQDTLEDGAYGPRMIVIPAGSFQMGSPDSEPDHTFSEAPQHLVRIGKPFALGITEVTFEDYDRFAKATGRELPDDNGWGRGQRPVIHVSWRDAVAYTKWLSEQTDQNYRLPSEAEWEYAARAGTTTPFFTGRCINTDTANYAGNYGYVGCKAKAEAPRGKTVLADSLPPNPWGLHGMHGNVYEWTADCWHGSYQGAPADGSAWGEGNGGNCSRRMTRGGSWNAFPSFLRSAARYYMPEATRQNDLGFRVAQSLK